MDGRNGGKMKIFFDITNKCNANCLYCFTNSDVEGYNNELSLNEIYHLIDEMVDNNISKISIAGGEPFLKNIDEIMRYCNGKIKLSVTSNGTILNDNILNALKETDTKLTISIDSLNQEIINKVRKGINIKNVITNIETLSKIPEIRNNLSLRATVSTVNIDYIEELIDFCNRLQIRKLKINSTNPFGRAIQNKNLIPNFHEFEKKYNDLREYVNQYSTITDVEIPVMKYLTKEHNQCLLGTNSIYINSIGNVYPCAFSNNKLVVGNIKDEKLISLINKCKQFGKNNEICRQCEIHRYEKKD